MDNNYCAPLAAILRKAQGCIDRDTDELIDVGGEVSKLRRICDSQRSTISRLREYAVHDRECMWDVPTDNGRCTCGLEALLATPSEESKCKTY